MGKVLFVVLAITSLLIGGIVAVSVWLPIADPLQKANAIVAISGGDTLGRAGHAVELYKQGWAREIVFSGAAKDPNSPSNAFVMKQYAVKAGVPEDAVSLEESSRDTKENAKKIKQAASEFDTIILVTSQYHQRRAHKEFSKVYGDSTVIINSPAQDKMWNTKTWWLTPYGWWISLTETAKLLF